LKGCAERCSEYFARVPIVVNYGVKKALRRGLLATSTEVWLIILFPLKIKLSKKINAESHQSKLLFFRIPTFTFSQPPSTLGVNLSISMLCQ
jgi:hypothetical protein